MANGPNIFQMLLVVIYQRYTKRQIQNDDYTERILPTDNKEIICRLVDARSFGSDVSLSYDDFAQSALQVLAAPLPRKPTTPACVNVYNNEIN